MNLKCVRFCPKALGEFLEFVWGFVNVLVCSFSLLKLWILVVDFAVLDFARCFVKILSRLFVLDLVFALILDFALFARKPIAFVWLGAVL